MIKVGGPRWFLSCRSFSEGYMLASTSCCFYYLRLFAISCELSLMWMRVGLLRVTILLSDALLLPYGGFSVYADIAPAPIDPICCFLIVALRFANSIYANSFCFYFIS